MSKEVLRERAQAQAAIQALDARVGSIQEEATLATTTALVFADPTLYVALTLYITRECSCPIANPN